MLACSPISTSPMTTAVPATKADSWIFGETLLKVIFIDRTVPRPPSPISLSAQFPAKQANDLFNLADPEEPCGEQEGDARQTYRDERLNQSYPEHLLAHARREQVINTIRDRRHDS